MDFYRVEHHTIMSGLVVRYKLLTAGLEVCASREGVLIQGDMPHITEPNDLQDVKAILQRAFEQYQSMVFSCHGKLFSFRSDPECVVELRKAHFAAEDETIEQRPRKKF